MKNFFKCITIFALSLLLHSFGERNKMVVGREYTFQILPQSFIIINGSSNVNKFACKVNRPVNVTLLKLHIQPDYTVKMNGSIKVNVDEFDCKHRVLTNDLRKTLKEDDFKQMTVYFASLDQLPLDSRKEQAINGTVLIELAGIKKAFNVPLIFVQTDEGRFQLKGTRSFSFEDFNLEPPKKVGGIIKVKNDFKTTFILNLKQA
jgi:hypothetical protein